MGGLERREEREEETGKGGRRGADATPCEERKRESENKRKKRESGQAPCKCITVGGH